MENLEITLIMRKYICLCILLFIWIPLLAQEATNVRAQQKGKDKIIITYDLQKTSDVEVQMSSADNPEFVTLKKVSGDIGDSIPAGKNRMIVWKPLEEYYQFTAFDVRFMVNATPIEVAPPKAKVRIAPVKPIRIAKERPKREVEQQFYCSPLQLSVAPEYNCLRWSYGIKFGQLFNGIGWYANLSTNFKRYHETSSYSDYYNQYCDADSTIASRLAVHAGVMWNCLYPAKTNFGFGFYAGIGYGKHDVQLYDIWDNQWTTYNPKTIRGLSGNFGVFFDFDVPNSHMSLNIGTTIIGKEHWEIEIGTGVCF
jgi:hypothetical protein